MVSAAGFWSYTRTDDEQDGGRILRLADRIQAEFSLLTGNDFDLFVDREAIVWGEAWRARIDDALDLTAFFIPIITPRYFARTECRREVLQFFGQASSFGVGELLLPILYVDCDLVPDSPDEVVRLISATQYEDWRHLRLMAEDSSEYRTAVNKLARRLVQIVVESSEKPTPTTVVSPSSPSDDNEPGYVDLLARGETAMTEWNETVGKFPPLMDVVTALTEEAAQDNAESDRKGKGFAGRLLVARRFAEKLGPVSDEIVQLGRQYASLLVDIDPAILTLIRMAVESRERGALDETEEKSSQEFFQSISGLADSAATTSAALKTLVETIELNAGISRDLRPVLRKVQQGLRDVVDGSGVIGAWKRRIDEFGLTSPWLPPSKHGNGKLI